MVLLVLTIILFAAMLGRWIAAKVRQPPVLGELLIGMLIANAAVHFFHQPLFELVMNLDRADTLLEQVLRDDVTLTQAAENAFAAEERGPGGIGARVLATLQRPDAAALVRAVLALWVFSNLGVILLLFMVGLESSVPEMLRVGPRATVVAAIGMVAPFALGYLSSLVLLPEAGVPARLFIAATLCATSVGVTARVFKDMGRMRSPEARIILGAAVIDDVLGLIVLAVVVGIVQTGELLWGEVLKIAGSAVLFLGLLMLLGEWIFKQKMRFFRLLDPRNYPLFLPLVFTFLLAWAASQIQLAAIVGAFAAGLVIREEMFERSPEHPIPLHEKFAPLEKLFAPVFFVLVGMQVNLLTFRDPSVLWVAAALTVAAVIGKLVAGAGAGKGVHALTVGIGMVPRGEVGLIFAQIGKSVGAISDGLFSALVLMVMVTTLVTPLGLKWALGKDADAQTLPSPGL